MFINDDHAQSDYDDDDDVLKPQKTVRAKGNSDEYMEWNHEDIYDWIMLIEDDKFNVYKQTLYRSLEEERVKGSDLKNVGHPNSVPHDEGNRSMRSKGS